MGEEQWHHMPGLRGIPFRTKNPDVPLIKHDDPYHKQPQQVVDMHVDTFDLADDEQRKSLQDILDRCAKGTAYQSTRHEQYDPDAGNWRVLLIWGEYFLEQPEERHVSQHHFG